MSISDSNYVNLIRNKIILHDSEKFEAATDDVIKSLVNNSVLPAKQENGKYTVNTLNGIFVSPKIYWENVEKNLEKYAVDEEDDTRKKIAVALGSSNLFPIRKFIRKFPDPQKDCFCNAEILLNTMSMTKDEAINHLYMVKDKANEPDEWLKPITEWLKNRKGEDFYGFYDVVEFKVVCTFDTNKYRETQKATLELVLAKKQKTNSPNLFQNRKTMLKIDLKKNSLNSLVMISPKDLQKLKNLVLMKRKGK